LYTISVITITIIVFEKQNFSFKDVPLTEKITLISIPIIFVGIPLIFSIPIGLLKYCSLSFSEWWSFNSEEPVRNRRLLDDETGNPFD
jgi:hypothetical protein